MLFFNDIKTKAFQSVDSASLAVFRIGFGIIMLWEVWRYFSANWIKQYYIDPEFHFSYYGFNWVAPWPGDGMYYHFALLGILALFITIGLFYRASIILYTIAFSYVFLIDQTYYLNHLYLVILIALILCILPANRFMAIDNKLGSRRQTDHVPVWSIWLLRIQFEIVLIFAGLVKINPDWLRLEPLGMWLEKRADFPILGDLFVQDWAIALAAYGVIALHIIGAPLLLWKRTRLFVFICYACFHTLNHFVFNIGIFPWFTLFGTLIFFDPNWPRQLRKKFKSLFHSSNSDTSVNNAEIDSSPAFANSSVVQQNITLYILAFWISVQIAIPLRHFFYPGNVSWTEEGHRFSWQMKLRSKVAKINFHIKDPHSQQTWSVNPHDFLSRRQTRKMAGRPDMILQFAHHLQAIWKQKYGHKDVEVYATVYASLNGRKPALLIDPAVDLAQIKRDLQHATWILPLNKPFRRLRSNDT